VATAQPAMPPCRVLRLMCTHDSDTNGQIASIVRLSPLDSHYGVRVRVRVPYSAFFAFFAQQKTEVKRECNRRLVDTTSPPAKPGESFRIIVIDRRGIGDMRERSELSGVSYPVPVVAAD
jgi:hypothetical protein